MLPIWITPIKRRSIIELPTELLLHIASFLPVSSRACLALTNKHCSNMLDGSFKHLQWPAEQPRNFPTVTAASEYHPERWTFLCLLGKDLQSQWSACSECFVLRRSRRNQDEAVARLIFWEPQRTGPCGTQPVHQGHRPSFLDGVVDLCPCIKLRQSTKREVLEVLEDQAQMRGESSKANLSRTKGQHHNGRCWHECWHEYGSIDINIRIYLSPLGSGGLGVKTQYDCVQKPGAFPQRPRLCCPHYGLEEWADDILACRGDHPWVDWCPECLDLRNCEYCATSIVDLAITGIVAEGRFAYSFSTARLLHDEDWYQHTVYPFSKDIDTGSAQVPRAEVARAQRFFDDRRSLKQSSLSDRFA